jgi:hypothetical protein
MDYYPGTTEPGIPPPITGKQIGYPGNNRESVSPQNPGFSRQRPCRLGPVLEVPELYRTRSAILWRAEASDALVIALATTCGVSRGGGP